MATYVATAAAVISTIVAVVVSVGAWNPWGRVIPIEPSGYAIVRGLPDGAVPDHLVFPLEWENERGGTVLVRKPRLTLTELQDGDPTGPQQVFQLVGRYPDISESSFSKPYTFGNSVTIEPHSVASDVFVFAPLYWYEPDNPDHDFRFRPGTSYRADINYFLNSDRERTTKTLLDDLTIYPSADDLNTPDEGGRFWGRWYIP